MDKSIRDALADIRTPCKAGRLLIEPTYRSGDFDSHGVDCPFVFRHEGRYWMTYVGWDSIGYQTGLASSDDLIHWKKEGIILPRGAVGSVTEYNSALTSIMRDNELFGSGELKRIGGWFVGTYHAYPKPGYESGPAVIGLCRSSDLRTWEVGEPVLYPEDEHEWEAGGLYKSWLMEHDGTYYLFYNAKTKAKHWKEQTGFATSRDMVKWQKHRGNPVVKVGAAGEFDDIFASDPCVLRHKGLWCMFYFGNSTNRHARDGVAFSRDLLSWEKSGEILIDVGREGSCDQTFAHKPAIIAKGGVLYHFYTAVKAVPGWKKVKMGDIEHYEHRGISLATSKKI
ncbi:MAG TPA: hypothetical protein VLH60_03445 [Sedimentisphaerales bacterium]|nr:hypothetical protein [Sedimentisphaerales bacterium]